MHPGEHGRLVRRQIDHAVGDNDIKAPGLQIQFIQALDIAAQKTHVVKAKLFGVPAAMAFGNRQLLGSHVHTNNTARRSGQLRQRINIAPGTTAQIENPATRELRRTDQPATVIAVQHFRMDA